MKYADQLLSRLASPGAQASFIPFESITVDARPVPTDLNGWHELHKTVNAFLNTRGGILLLGVKEEGTGAHRRYSITEWQDGAEPKLKEFPQLFSDRADRKQNLFDCFPPMEIRNLLGKRVAVVYVDELPADRKFVFLNGVAYRRSLTGDHRITVPEIEAQEEFKTEAVHAKELQPVSGMTERDLDLTKLNQFIYYLNQPQPIETLKPDLDSARAFLQRRYFLKDDAVTVLGALVCGAHPGDRLGFRCHVHGYVDAPHQIAQDKQDFVDNVIPLMEAALGYLLRNIQVGISADRGGVAAPQYPEEVLRETVNNALAHRDYSVNGQVILAIKPGVHVSIQNPGRFRPNLLIEDEGAEPPVLRILPEAKPRNPKLADVLRVYRKWEGRGIGMATLVNLCLGNRIDVPFYRIHTEDVCLYLRAGRLLDERMERLFQSFDRYIADRLDGASPSEEQKRVLAYLIKSEWANEAHGYTILLTPDNNHFAVLRGLERSGLISKHAKSTTPYPIYTVDRVLVRIDYARELRSLFGAAFDELDNATKESLGVVYRHNEFSTVRYASAKQVAFALWDKGDGGKNDIKEFDSFYRKVRRIFNKLEKGGFVRKPEGSAGYELCKDYRATHLC